MTRRKNYDNDGFLAAIEAIPPDKVEHYRQKCADFVETYNTHPEFSAWTYSKTELILRWVADLATEPLLLDIVEELIGPDILLWNAFLPVKPPQSTANFGWHQDATYWPIAPTDQIASAWVALGPVDSFSGGMQMVRGSHLQGALPHEATYDKTSMLRRGQRVTTNIDDTRVVNIELEPGQASIHHSLTLHRSGANKSANWRFGVGLNYVSANVKPLPGYQDSAILLRGDAKPDGFQLTGAPQEDLHPKALENYARMQQLQSKRYADIKN